MRSIAPSIVGLTLAVNLASLRGQPGVVARSTWRRCAVNLASLRGQPGVVARSTWRRCAVNLASLLFHGRDQVWQ